jgi:hypothetical protein
VLALLEAVALAVHLQDVHVVGEAVQQCAGQPFRPQHFGQLLKGQVAGHQRRATLVTDCGWGRKGTKNVVCEN